MKDMKHSTYFRLDSKKIVKELKKARLGKPTVLPFELLVYESVLHHPTARRKIAKIFSITEG